MNYRCKLRFFVCLVAGVLLLSTYKLFLYIFHDGEFSKYFSSRKTSRSVEEWNVMQQSTGLSQFEGERIIHLDLKGAAPSLHYFKQIFPLLRSLNVTGLLIEYEDMFPYSSRLTHARNTYSMADIQLLLKMAEQNKLSVIPLVQTFGHLEFLLKIKKFSHLREVFNYPQSICPSNEETFDIISSMLDEVINAHLGIRYLHIGCDEVYQLGICTKCAEKMKANKWNINELFLAHVSRIAGYIRSKYADIIPLVWDDQFRSIATSSLRKFNIGKLVEPVIWYYRPVVSFPPEMWEKYSEIFPTVWTASSFKGVTGPDQILTDTMYHIQNQKSWLHVMKEHANAIAFKGIIVTGWQRYDHFAVLCELLPVSIPTLVNVILLLEGTTMTPLDVSNKVRDVLMCGRKNKISSACRFPGVDVYNAVVKFSNVRAEIDEVFQSSPVKGWFSVYNLEVGYFNPRLVNELVYKLRECYDNLQRSKELLKVSLKNVYDSYTVTEWLETNVTPYLVKLDRLAGTLHYISNITEWAPRPVRVLHDKPIEIGKW